MPKKIDLIGRRFGRLLVLREAPKTSLRPRWECRCDCGSYITTDGNNLRGGGSQSCGCARRENFHSRTHGQAGTPLYQIWKSIRGRCGNPSDTAYRNYGGRGITVCEAWQSFEGFSHDMGSGYAKGLHLDRIDNDGHYERSNCRWTTRKENNRNTRQNVWVDIAGKRTILADVLPLIGRSGSTVSAYMRRHKVGHQQAIEHYLRKLAVLISHVQLK